VVSAGFINGDARPSGRASPLPLASAGAEVAFAGAEVAFAGAEVAFATADGTAKSGSDYVATSGVLTFAPGQTSATVDVPVLGDTLAEPREPFSLVLSAPSANATLAKPSGVATITDDDGPRITVTGRTLKADRQRSFTGVLATFTDVDFVLAADVGRFTATVRWGDGTSSAGSIACDATAMCWDVLGTRRYARKGKFSVSVQVADANGATGAALSRMTV
jgi:hypothetical protein